MVGQKAIVDTLRNQVITGRIPHAYLFCGSRGTGKTSSAKILAKAINCENPQNGDPCGQCPNCLRLERDESLDVVEIDAASNNGVDEMRDLRDTVKYPPQFGKYKVYIIDEVHMLSTSAFNALLKTLEEPPEHVVFILATTEPQKLPETILSRCQRFDFGRIPVNDIQGRLLEAVQGSGAEASNGALMIIARAAEGGMRDALSILDMCLGYSDHIDEKLVRSILGTTDRAFLFSFADAILEERSGDVFRMIDEIMKDGRDAAVFAKDVSAHFRALLLAASCGSETGEILDLTREDAEEYVRQGNKYTITRLMKILDLFMNLETEMRFVSRPRIALENTSLKACLRSEETDMQAVNDRLLEMERKIQNLTQMLNNGTSIQTAPDPSAGARNKKDGENGEKERKNEITAMPASGDEQGNVWQALMNRFKTAEIGIWSILKMGSLVREKDGLFQWKPDSLEGSDALAVTLNKKEKKEKIETCLQELTGRECRFETVNEIPDAKEDHSEMNYLDTIYETFGHEPVHVVENLESQN